MSKLTKDQQDVMQERVNHLNHLIDLNNKEVARLAEQDRTYENQESNEKRAARLFLSDQIHTEIERIEEEKDSLEEQLRKAQQPVYVSVLALLHAVEAGKEDKKLFQVTSDSDYDVPTTYTIFRKDEYGTVLLRDHAESIVDDFFERFFGLKER